MQIAKKLYNVFFTYNYSMLKVYYTTYMYYLLYGIKDVQLNHNYGLLRITL